MADFLGMRIMTKQQTPIQTWGEIFRFQLVSTKRDGDSKLKKWQKSSRDVSLFGLLGSSGIDSNHLTVCHGPLVSRDVLPSEIREQRNPVWVCNYALHQNLSMVQWSPVFYHVLLSGRKIKHTHTYTRLPHVCSWSLNNSRGSESLGATGGDSGGQCAEIGSNSGSWPLKHLDFKICQPMKKWDLMEICMCIMYASCIESGIFDPWQLGWLLIRRQDFQPDTCRGQFGIYI